MLHCLPLQVLQMAARFFCNSVNITFTYLLCTNKQNAFLV